MNSSKLLVNLYFSTSALFAPIAFIANLLVGIFIGESYFIKLGGILLIFAICFIISAFIVVIKDAPLKLISKSRLFAYSVGFYTAISLVINIFVQVIATTIASQPNKLWNVFSVVITLAFSIVISALIIYFKPKSTVAFLITYFFVIGIFYYLLTITFGGLGNGNRIIITLAIYIVTYTLIALAYLLVKAKKHAKQRDSKTYQKQF